MPMFTPFLHTSMYTPSILKRSQVIIRIQKTGFHLFFASFSFMLVYNGYVFLHYSQLSHYIPCKRFFDFSHILDVLFLFGYYYCLYFLASLPFHLANCSSAYSYSYFFSISIISFMPSLFFSFSSFKKASSSVPVTS